MSGEVNLSKLLSGMNPKLNKGDYIFSTISKKQPINQEDVLMSFKESEGTTVILEQEKADKLGLKYDYVASWITLSIHSSLEAVGLTAAFSTALAEKDICCNVVAGYYHDHIFVDKIDTKKAMKVLEDLSK